MTQTGREVEAKTEFELIHGSMLAPEMEVAPVLVWLLMLRSLEVKNDMTRRVLVSGVMGELVMSQLLLLEGRWML